MVGEEEENKKKCFHKMATKFFSPGRIHSTSSNSDQNEFGCH
jgi:hypothetical protein